MACSSPPNHDAAVHEVEETDPFSSPVPSLLSLMSPTFGASHVGRTFPPPPLTPLSPVFHRDSQSPQELAEQRQRREQRAALLSSALTEALEILQNFDDSLFSPSPTTSRIRGRRPGQEEQHQSEDATPFPEQ